MNLQEKAVSYIIENPNASPQQTMSAISCGKSVYYSAKSAIDLVNEMNIDKDEKLVVSMGDLHCGHKVGLTPPEWWENPYKWKLRQQQEEMWNFYSKTIKGFGYIDILLVNGDLIDGKGKRSGGTELITTDRHEQCDIATRCILEANVGKIYITFGTPYHSGNSEDFETQVAKDVNAEEIKDQLFVDINGTVFDVKHAVGSSTVPYGRSTATSKAKTWNREWAEKGNQPKSDVIIRNHVHYKNLTTDGDYVAITSPALQGPDTKFGGRKCEGVVDYGLTSIRVKKDQKVTHQDVEFHTKELETFKQELLVA